ncbi:MAG: phosphate/phosphite/phosphonate ABC transporter substrate-binding protein [Anaerolineae bacterium]
MNQIRMMTCLGENTVPICTELTNALTEKLQIEFLFDPIAEPTPAAEKLVRGDVQMGWICGLLYVEKVDHDKALLDLLAAPIFTGTNKPIYTSHLIVPRNSQAQSLSDLQGKTHAINEFTSWSGNHLMRAQLFEQGLSANFFSEIIVSGAHSKSVRMVAEGRADSAAIDHGVFDYVADTTPELIDQIRIIDQVGPSPAPPFVIHRSVPHEIQNAIQLAIVELGQDESFQQLVKPHRLKTLVPITDADYDPIRAGYQNSLAL